MKPTKLTVLALGLLLSALAVSCSDKESEGQGSTVINGLEWANTNVGQPGAFAERPDMYTPFYQWNRPIVAWSATGVLVEGWNSTPDESATWTAGTPCPQGWRLPTWDEYIALDSAGGEFEGRGGTWAEANARGNTVAGRFYGPSCASCSLPNTMEGCIFFPASGRRSRTDGSLGGQGTLGLGWSSMQHNTVYGYRLDFNSTASTPANYNSKAYGFPVRCVR
jgi:uncharacterized protein (TIGR02145 family)